MSRDFFSLYPESLDPGKAHLPLLLLDIDGVINAWRYRPAETNLPITGYEDLTEYDVPADNGRTYRFWTSPSLLADIIALHESNTVEIAWLTTWQHQANDHVSPTLGLPTFPVAADQGGRFSDYHWKSRAAVEALQLQRSIIWIDDTEIDEDSRRTYAESNVPHLLITPNDQVGLTKADIASIREFAAAVATG